LADIVSEEQTPLARPAPEPSVSRHRFGIAYLVLAAIVGAAVGLVVVLATRDDGHTQTTRTWSTWAPRTTGTLGAREIARHVSGQYHLENGSLLTAVVAGPMEIESSQGPVPVSAILVRSGKAGVRQERIDVAFPEAGVFFQLVGSGANNSIPGQATLTRGQLVRREALELALYTFRYVDGVDAVVAFLPPKPNSPSYAVFFKKNDLDNQLDHPLVRTLPQRKPPVPGKLSPIERRTIDDLTLSRYFRFELQRANNGARVLVLRPAAV
jgi:hypothetical protein